MSLIVLNLERSRKMWQIPARTFDYIKRETNSQLVKVRQASKVSDILKRARDSNCSVSCLFTVYYLLKINYSLLIGEYKI